MGFAKTPEGRLRYICAKLGPKLESTMARLKAGESKNRVAADLGINARWLGFLNPLLEKELKKKAQAEMLARAKGPAPPQPRVKGAFVSRDLIPPADLDLSLPAPEEVVTDERVNMFALRTLLVKRMSMNERVSILIKHARSKDERISANAVKEINELTGLIASKVAIEPDPPPLFKLPEHSMPSLLKYEDWVRTQNVAEGSTDTDVGTGIGAGPSPTPSPSCPPSAGAPPGAPSPKKSTVH